MDGGSKDGSVDILRRYEEWIDLWVSEPDGGQTAAINKKGWRRAKGEYLTWLSYHDVLAAGRATAMAGALQDDETIDLAYCDVQTMETQSRPLWSTQVGRQPSSRWWCTGRRRSDSKAF
jgi:hypothetical protein